MYKEMPCITCPVLAICRTKASLECEILANYFKGNPHIRSISRIQEVLPKFGSVSLFNEDVGERVTFQFRSGKRKCIKTYRV